MCMWSNFPDNNLLDSGSSQGGGYYQYDENDPVNDIYAYSKITTTRKFIARNHNHDSENREQKQRSQTVGTVSAVVVVVILLVAGLSAGMVLFLRRRMKEPPDYSAVEDARETRVGSVSL